MTRAVWWIGRPPQTCGFCHKPIGNTFVDAKDDTGTWAFADLACARIHKMQIGVGKGQMYRRQDNGRFMQVGE